MIRLVLGLVPGMALGMVLGMLLGLMLGMPLGLVLGLILWLVRAGIRRSVSVAVRGYDRPPGVVPVQERLQGCAGDAGAHGPPVQRAGAAVRADGDAVQHPPLRVHVEQHG